MGDIKRFIMTRAFAGLENPSSMGLSDWPKILRTDNFLVNGLAETSRSTIAQTKFVEMVPKNGTIGANFCFSDYLD